MLATSVIAFVAIPGRQQWLWSRLWWLPRVGVDNGLAAKGWAPILEVDALVEDDLLAALRELGVPAFASPDSSIAQRLGNGCLQPSGYRLWVGTSRYGTAAETLVRTLGKIGQPHTKATADRPRQGQR